MTTTPLPLGDAALEQVVADGLAEVERRLDAAVSSTDVLSDAPSRHLVSAGGKRMRPALALLTAQLGTGTSDAVLEAAVAVELTHLATLYHDDVMDSAPTRRGAPSAHEVWGNSVAILTGDLLFARASRLVSELGPDAVRVQAETFERLCLGQLHETIGPQDGEDAVAHYLDVLAGKTGSLIAASARYGAMFAQVPPEALDVVVRYGEKVGIAFQLADDVIDLLSDADVTGKTPGTDLREGVATMPVLLLRARGERGQLDDAGHRLLERLDGDLSDDADLADAVAALRAHDVIDEARDLARRWAADAVAELDALPDSPVRRALAVFATLVVDRLA